MLLFRMSRLNGSVTDLIGVTGCVDPAALEGFDVFVFPTAVVVLQVVVAFFTVFVSNLLCWESGSFFVSGDCECRLSHCSFPLWNSGH